MAIKLEFVPERSETLREQLASALRQAVLSGKLKPGERLVESQLATMMQVSRGPVREAIFQLVEEGLLEQIPYRGTIVRTLDLKDLTEIYSFRILIETFAFETVWDRRDSKYRSELDRRHRALSEAIDNGDPEGAITSELNLHGLVYEASGHRILLDTWIMLRRRLNVYFSLLQTAHNRIGPLRDAHDDYVRISKGESLEEMRREIEGHMRRGHGRLEEFLRSRHTE